MTVYIDPPTWPGHGRMWSHLVSDVSYDELHAFAGGHRLPAAAPSSGTTTTCPSHRYADAVRRRARWRSAARNCVRRLTEAGLRRPKHRPAPAGGAPGVAD